MQIQPNASRRTIAATASGINLAKKIADCLPGEPLDGRALIFAKKLGYHANYKFEGVEASQAYHRFVSEDDDADRDQVASLMRALLSKIELGQALNPTEEAFAAAPILNLSLSDTQDSFCFSLSAVLSHSGATWVELSCQDLDAGSSLPMEVSFQWP